ncbi:transposase [Streptosporangium sp. NBC_01756]|nr:Tn3 family transposase [Streptosporangium sp. NBC_01756]WSC84350.1 transposase [Streptosporangium sp. NBC_01756]
MALFSHLIPCGVWKAVYIIEGLLKNASEIQPDTIHADTQGQSLPVFGLAALMGFDVSGHHGRGQRRRRRRPPRRPR